MQQMWEDPVLEMRGRYWLSLQGRTEGHGRLLGNLAAKVSTAQADDRISRVVTGPPA
jgi:hypothetical protein